MIRAFYWDKVIKSVSNSSVLCIILSATVSTSHYSLAWPVWVTSASSYSNMQPKTTIAVFSKTKFHCFLVLCQLWVIACGSVFKKPSRQGSAYLKHCWVYGREKEERWLIYHCFLKPLHRNYIPSLTFYWLHDHVSYQWHRKTQWFCSKYSYWETIINSSFIYFLVTKSYWFPLRIQNIPIFFQKKQPDSLI